MGKNKKKAEADQTGTTDENGAVEAVDATKQPDQQPKPAKQPKQPKQKQPKPPPPPEMLFHESLGKELTGKFKEITDNPVRRPSVATYFATGIIEEDLQQDAKATVVRTVQETVLIDSKNSADGASDAPPMPQHAPSATPSVEESVPIPRSRTDSLEHATESEEPVDKKSIPGKMYSLRDMNASQTIEALVARHGRMTHMGVRDHNYDFFLNKSRTGVISYRLVDEKVAVISGDPICPVSMYSRLLEEFGTFCKYHKWQWAIQGASKEMADLAKVHSWTTVQYGKERALNVQTNPVLLGSEGKRIRTQCKQLQKTVNVGIYCPAYNRDVQLEQQIVDMYDNWRLGRNTSRAVQAFVTVFDLLSLHRLMIYVYATDKDGKLLGFAALRRLRDGYHIDPITVDPDAPRGMTDLLLVASMALLKESHISRLVLGVEPLDELGEITGMSRMHQKLTRESHKLISAELPLGGKKGFNDRFRPDDAFEEELFMIYPNSPSIKQSVAMAHFANIHLHDAVKQRVAKEREKRRRTSDPDKPEQAHANLSTESIEGATTTGSERSHSVAGRSRGSSEAQRPTHHRHSSSKLRIFHHSHEGDHHELVSDAEGHDVVPPDGQSTDNLLRPHSRSGRSPSPLRFFHRHSHSHSGPEGGNGLDPYSDLGAGNLSQDGDSLRPPTEHRRSSRSPGRMHVFRRKSSDLEARDDERGRTPDPTPIHVALAARGRLM